MKLINYNRGYSNFFDCSIHGRIVVSNEEWGKIKKYVSRYLFDKDDAIRFISTKKGRAYNIRTTATAKVINHFNILGYKRGNYTFDVLN